ncbi:MAG: Uma2 family endonuclease [Chloroflexota bacterium]|nr:Uma2 family endonuclease [Chloroflexota bacterium]MDE2958704.1 Uma2 family endonuclease [Chloroflexota bacterium]
MTTTRSAQPPGTPVQTTPFFRLPDIPEKHPDDMTSFQHLAATGNAHNVAQYLGKQDTTIVSGERYIVPGPAYVAGESRYPDLMVAFDADLDAYEASNGYVISEQGKPPDFILEVASRHSAREDREGKKDYYERLEVGELWLFDSEGRFHGFTLRGYRLVDGRYEEIESNEIAPGVFQGYSAALNLILRVEDGVLGLYDPATEEHIPTFQSERARADAERAARISAEARAQELEAELDRLREGR